MSEKYVHFVICSSLNHMSKSIIMWQCLYGSKTLKVDIFFISKNSLRRFKRVFFSSNHIFAHCKEKTYCLNFANLTSKFILLEKYMYQFKKMTRMFRWSDDKRMKLLCFCFNTQDMRQIKLLTGARIKTLGWSNQ